MGHKLLKWLVSVGLRRLMRGGAGMTTWLAHSEGDQGLMCVKVSTRWDHKEDKAVYRPMDEEVEAATAALRDLTPIQGEEPWAREQQRRHP